MTTMEFVLIKKINRSPKFEEQKSKSKEHDKTPKRKEAC